MHLLLACSVCVRTKFPPLTKFCIFISQFHRLGRVLHLPFTQAIAASYPLQITLQHDPDKVHEPANLLLSTQRVPRPHCHPPSSLPPALEPRAPISHRSGKVGEPNIHVLFSLMQAQPAKLATARLLVVFETLPVWTDSRFSACTFIVCWNACIWRVFWRMWPSHVITFCTVRGGWGGGGNLAPGCSTTSRVVHG